MRRPFAAALLAFALALSSCTRHDDTPVELAVAGATNAHVTLAADGDHVAAAWAATGPAGTNVYVARSDDAARTFGPPVRVNDIDGDANINGEAPPRVVLSGSRIDVVWVAKRNGVSAIRAAESVDGGATFAPARTVTAEGVQGARGWQTAAIAADGTVHAAWLDGRNATRPAASAAPANAGAHVHHGDMRQDIYHAMWRGGDAAVETQVASNVCFCCKTALVSQGPTVYVAWRHLFPGGVRDIAIARSSDSGRTFSDPVRVSADDWKIDACPDDGPAMAIDAGGTLHVVWPTLATDSGSPRIAVFHATSSDGGKTFSPRARVNSPDAPAAHPKMTLDTAGRAVVAWDETSGGARRIRLRIADQALLTLSTGNASSYPAVVAAGSAIVAAWTDQSNGGSVVRVLRVR